MAFEESGHLSLWNAERHSELCRIVEVDAEKDGVLLVTYETTEGTEDRLELELLEKNRLRLGKQGTLWERR